MFFTGSRSIKGLIKMNRRRKKKQQVDYVELVKQKFAAIDWKQPFNKLLGDHVYLTTQRTSQSLKVLPPIQNTWMLSNACVQIKSNPNARLWFT